METGTLSPGRSMTVDYDLPAGQYVVMCFFPDPKMGGMPHSLMGMLRMIHLSLIRRSGSGSPSLAAEPHRRQGRHHDVGVGRLAVVLALGGGDGAEVAHAGAG